jgi:hypothetical protein
LFFRVTLGVVLAPISSSGNELTIWLICWNTLDCSHAPSSVRFLIANVKIPNDETTYKLRRFSIQH